MGVVDDAFKKATAGLDFKHRFNRLRGAYVRRRGNHLHDQHKDWDADKLANQLKAEQTAVIQYLDTKKSLIDGSETVKPPHLDLKAESQYHKTLATQANQQTIERIYRDNRVTCVPQIVWRAVAIHNELWKSLGPPPKLEKAALDELLDRRLRVVEQMNCNVNALPWNPLTVSHRPWDIRGAKGPWKDGFLVRNFEYPILPVAHFFPILFPIPPDKSEWKIEGNHYAFEHPKNKVRIRLTNQVVPAWNGNTKWITFVPKEGRKLTDVIRRMFDPPRENFLERNLLFCDMVGAALSIEALWLGLHRRNGNDDAFEAIPAINTDYVALGPVVRFVKNRDLDVLMCDDRDPYFENTEIDIDDLQVGDFVCFWNSRIYDLLVETGEWGNEFSYVMGIDLDENGKVRVLTNGPQIWLSGHGLGTMFYNEMASGLIDFIKNIVIFIFTIVASQGGGLKEISFIAGQKLERWEPYESFDHPGAWWIRIPKTVWHDAWDYTSVSEVLKSVPRTVAHQTAVGGAGYTQPTDTDAAYFPITEPQVARTSADRDSWDAYLRQRKANASFRAPSKLNPLAADKQLAQGLYYRGSNAKINVVRPRPRK